MVNSNYPDIWGEFFDRFLDSGNSDKVNLDEAVEDLVDEFELTNGTTIKDVYAHYLRRRLGRDVRTRGGLYSMGKGVYVDPETITDAQIAMELMKRAKNNYEAAVKMLEKMRDMILSNQNFHFDFTTGDIKEPLTFDSIVEELKKIAGEQ